MISDRAKALVLALDDQAWNGPGYLDYARKCEIVQEAFDRERQDARFDVAIAMGVLGYRSPALDVHVSTPHGQADGMDAYDDPQGEM